MVTCIWNKEGALVMLNEEIQNELKLCYKQLYTTWNPTQETIYTFKCKQLDIDKLTPIHKSTLGSEISKEMVHKAIKQQK